jgi:DNA (cytosine-5)-methyltransferase 1
MERIQGFPTNWTRDCNVDGTIMEMPVNKRKFMMGNALVVNIIKRMEPQLSAIVDAE